MHKSHCQKRQHFKIPSCMTPNSLPPFTMQELLAHNATPTPRGGEGGRERISPRRCRPIAFRREIFVTRASRDGQIVRPCGQSVRPSVRAALLADDVAVLGVTQTDGGRKSLLGIFLRMNALREKSIQGISAIFMPKEKLISQHFTMYLSLGSSKSSGSKDASP